MPAKLMNLKVICQFGHRPEAPGKGKPQLKIHLTLAKYQSGVMPKIVPALIAISGQPKAFIQNAILDTGASISAMSTEHAYDSFFQSLSPARLAEYPEKEIQFADGREITGRRVWMYMSILPTSTRILIPFVISDKLKAPVLISWRAIRKAYHFVLTHKELALCE